MPRPRLYDGPTVVVACRLPAGARALFESLALDEGVTLAAYSRRVMLDHLRTLGYHSEEPKEHDTPERWLADRVEHGEVVRATAAWTSGG